MNTSRDDIADARTAPVAVWQMLESLKGDALTQWRVSEVKNRSSIADRNLDLPYPYGWYPTLFSSELKVGEVKPLRYFGRDLVMWRGEDGAPRMLDAYCRHLGANMGHGGKVVGNLLQCPFHAWSYDGEGVVHAIPYAKTVPPQMTRPCNQQWPLCEANRFIWMWYHPNGEPPSFEVERHPESGDPAWTDYDVKEWYVWGNIQNMAENGVDAAHFKYVHGTATFPEYKMSWDGVRRDAYIDAKMGTPKGEVDGRISYVANGPGQSWTRFTGISETLLISALTPMEKDKVHARFCFTQPKSQAEGPMANLAKALIRDICKQFDQDKVIWDRQRYQDRPVICDGDGPIVMFRHYYRQFYAELGGKGGDKFKPLSLEGRGID
jgi:phenylpropionate dioxygenase-like ring-hydroxylating dioxygenase large terminal subunit